MMIRAIFFDFDGVLTMDASGSITLGRAFSKVSPATNIDACASFFHEQAHALDVGQVGVRDLLPVLATTCGCEIDPDALPKVFVDVPWNEPMLELARALSKTYRVGIITDNDTERVECLADALNFRTLFSPIIVSADVGSTKVEPHIFERALAAVGCRGEECVFIDNRERNLRVPSSMGFRTYLFGPAVNDVEALRARLREWGVRW